MSLHVSSQEMWWLFDSLCLRHSANTTVSSHYPFQFCKLQSHVKNKQGVMHAREQDQSEVKTTDTNRRRVISLTHMRGQKKRHTDLTALCWPCILQHHVCVDNKEPVFTWCWSREKKKQLEPNYTDRFDSRKCGTESSCCFYCSLQNDPPYPCAIFIISSFDIGVYM